MSGVLQNIRTILQPTKSITKEELFNELFAKAKQRFVIDPEQIVNRQNNGDLTQALQKAQQFSQRTLQQPVDRDWETTH